MPTVTVTDSGPGSGSPLLVVMVTVNTAALSCPVLTLDGLKVTESVVESFVTVRLTEPDVEVA